MNKTMKKLSLTSETLKSLRVRAKLKTGAFQPPEDTDPVCKPGPTAADNCVK